MKAALFLQLISACVIGTFCATCSLENEVSTSSGHLTSCSISKAVQQSKKCGSWWRNYYTCYYYSKSITTFSVCADGYAGNSCNLPVCNEKSGSQACQPDGYCSSPGQCVCPNKLYYADGPQCKFCIQKDHCKNGHTTCTTRTNAKCEECEHKNNNYDAYKLDNGNCQTKCSWIGKRHCYPGFCKNDLLSNCVCTGGFHGTESGDCRTITTSVDTLDPVMKFWDTNDNSGDTLWLHVNGKSQSSAPVNWTNRVQLDRANFSVFLDNPCGLKNLSNSFPSPPKYINANDSKCGLLTASIHIQLKKASGEAYDFYHNALSTNNPRQSLDFKHSFHLSGLTSHGNLSHLDAMLVYLTAKNGGYIKYFNFDRDPPILEQFALVGKTSTTYSWLKFDMVQPSHLCETQEKCQVNPLEVPDVTTEAENTVSWEGWSDTPAGIKEWKLHVYAMEYVNHQLRFEEQIYQDSIMPTGQEHGKHTVKMKLEAAEPGMYSVHLTSTDKAGNSITARRLMLYDDNPTVTKHGRTPVVSGATKTEDGCLWITTPMQGFYVKWPHRFRNVKLYRNYWLERVVPMKTTKKFLEDHEGLRQVSPVRNAWGIVRFETSFTVVQQGKVTTHPFSVVPNMKQGSVIKEVLMNEKHISIQVRAFDIFGKFEEDVVNVTVDFSPPEIQALWLSTNRSNLEDYVDELTVTWEVFDDVSGLLDLTWEIVEGTSKESIARGYVDVSPQNGTEECIPAHLYITYSHRPPCYCTEMHGCFSSVFRMQPDDDTKTKLHNRPKNEDFAIKIKATNKAMLYSEYSHDLFN